MTLSSICCRFSAIPKFAVIAQASSQASAVEPVGTAVDKNERSSSLVGAAYEKAQEQILRMADMLSAGIISQCLRGFDSEH